MKTEIISITEKEKWNSIVLKTKNYDFYHMHSYNSIENTGNPILFVVSDNDNLIMFPLVIRAIPNAIYYDCTSVYGYPGPSSNKSPQDLPEEIKCYFYNELINFFKEEKIIAAFSRLHPIIKQELFFEKFGKVLNLNKTVAINLTDPLDIQRQKYRKSNKSEVNQLSKKGYVVKKVNSKEDIDVFTSIYLETMRRVNADEYYFFNSDYFHKFLNVDDFNAILLLAYKENEITAGAIFTATKYFMQYHLAGTKNEYINDAPMKLIIDYARLLGTQMGLQYLHLGGGVAGSNEDSLFRFKSGFSDLTFTYKIWQYIVNDDVYMSLVEERAKEKKLNTNYFPLYRG